MKFLKRLGLGALIWIIMYAWVSLIMFGFGLKTGIMPQILTWIGAFVAVWFIAGTAKIKNSGDGFFTGLIFVIVGLILDWLITSKFNSAIFSSFSLWIGYAITLLLPMFRISKKR